MVVSFLGTFVIIWIKIIIKLCDSQTIVLCPKFDLIINPKNATEAPPVIP